jgi:drug/metabolite transporter (DMT)-like permease
MPQVSQLFFKAAILFLLLGIGMGLQMSISGNHNVIGAHAHTNLLGWVTSALFGTYYALNQEKAAQRLAMIQFGVYTLGVVVMVPSLYLLLQGNAGAEPFVAISSLITFLGAAIFAFIVFAPTPAREMPRGPLAVN